MALTGPTSSQDRRVQCYLQYRYTVCTYIHVLYRFMQVGYLWVILHQSLRSLTRASMTDSLYRGLCKDSMILYSILCTSTKHNSTAVPAAATALSVVHNTGCFQILSSTVCVTLYLTCIVPTFLTAYLPGYINT